MGILSCRRPGAIGSQGIVDGQEYAQGEKLQGGLDEAPSRAYHGISVRQIICCMYILLWEFRVMDYRHVNKRLRQLDEKRDYDGGYDYKIVKAFRKVMQAIRAAPDERSLIALRSLRFERLKGNRKHQYSMRLNDQFRLILEIEKTDRGSRMIVVGIEDYH
jgi:proteic killer suppression protein